MRRKLSRLRKATDLLHAVTLEHCIRAIYIHAACMQDVVRRGATPVQAPASSAGQSGARRRVCARFSDRRTPEWCRERSSEPPAPLRTRRPRRTCAWRRCALWRTQRCRRWPGTRRWRAPGCQRGWRLRSRRAPLTTTLRSRPSSPSARCASPTPRAFYRRLARCGPPLEQVMRGAWDEQMGQGAWACVWSCRADGAGTAAGVVVQSAALRSSAGGG